MSWHNPHASKKQDDGAADDGTQGAVEGEHGNAEDDTKQDMDWDQEDMVDYEDDDDEDWE